MNETNKAWSWTSFLIPTALRQRLLKFLIKKTFGPFLLDDLSTEQLQFKDNGVVELNDLQLDITELNAVQSHIDFTDAYIESVSIDIPWSDLWNSECKIIINQVSLRAKISPSSSQTSPSNLNSQMFQSVYSDAFMMNSQAVARDFISEEQFYDFEQVDTSGPTSNEGTDLISSIIDQIASRIKIQIQSIKLDFDLEGTHFTLEIPVVKYSSVTRNFDLIPLKEHNLNIEQIGLYFGSEQNQVKIVQAIQCNAILGQKKLDDSSLTYFIKGNIQSIDFLLSYEIFKSIEIDKIFKFFQIENDQQQIDQSTISQSMYTAMSSFQSDTETHNYSDDQLNGTISFDLIIDKFVLYYDLSEDCSIDLDSLDSINESKHIKLDFVRTKLQTGSLNEDFIYKVKSDDFKISHFDPESSLERFLVQFTQQEQDNQLGFQGLFQNFETLKSGLKLINIQSSMKRNMYVDPKLLIWLDKSGNFTVQTKSCHIHLDLKIAVILLNLFQKLKSLNFPTRRNSNSNGSLDLQIPFVQILIQLNNLQISFDIDEASVQSCLSSNTLSFAALDLKASKCSSGVFQELFTLIAKTGSITFKNQSHITREIHSNNILDSCMKERPQLTLNLAKQILKSVQQKDEFDVIVQFGCICVKLSSNQIDFSWVQELQRDLNFVNEQLDRTHQLLQTNSQSDNQYCKVYIKSLQASLENSFDSYELKLDNTQLCCFIQKEGFVYLQIKDIKCHHLQFEVANSFIQEDMNSIEAIVIPRNLQIVSQISSVAIDLDQIFKIYKNYLTIQSEESNKLLVSSNNFCFQIGLEDVILSFADQNDSSSALAIVKDSQIQYESLTDSENLICDFNEIQVWISKSNFQIVKMNSKSLIDNLQEFMRLIGFSKILNSKQFRFKMQNFFRVIIDVVSVECYLKKDTYQLFLELLQSFQSKFTSQNIDSKLVQDKLEELNIFQDVETDYFTKVDQKFGLNQSKNQSEKVSDLQFIGDFFGDSPSKNTNDSIDWVELHHNQSLVSPLALFEQTTSKVRSDSFSEISQSEDQQSQLDQNKIDILSDFYTPRDIANDSIELKSYSLTIKDFKLSLLDGHQFKNYSTHSQNNSCNDDPVLVDVHNDFIEFTEDQNGSQTQADTSADVKDENSEENHVDIVLKEFMLSYSLFKASDPDKPVDQCSIAVGDLIIQDFVQSSNWKNLITTQYTMQDKAITALANGFNLRQGLSVDYRLKLAIQPMRVFADQDTLSFINRFFICEQSIQGVKNVNSTYFSFVQVNRFKVIIDYKPKKINYTNLQSGNYIELLNIFSMEGVDIALPSLQLRAVSGISQLFSKVMEQWISSIINNNSSKIVTGITPIKGLVNIGNKLVDMVVLPIDEYNHQGNVLNSVKRSSMNFMQTLTSETLKFGAQVLSGTQNLLENADLILSDAPNLQSSSKSTLSRNAQQPKDIKSGLDQATHTILAIPRNVQQSDKPLQYIFIKPAIGISEAIRQGVLGLKNTIDQNGRDDMEKKYKKK